MKYKVLLSLLCILSAAIYAHAEASPSDSVMLISVEKTAVRLEPSFVSPVLFFADYKTPFAIIRTQGDWMFGYAQGFAKAGYVHIRALSPVKVTLSADTAMQPPELQQNEIVLAGKGFSSSLEESLREGNAFNFDAVDTMERLQYSYAECMDFILGIDAQPGAW